MNAHAMSTGFEDVPGQNISRELQMFFVWLRSHFSDEETAKRLKRLVQNQAFLFENSELNPATGTQMRHDLAYVMEKVKYVLPPQHISETESVLSSMQDHLAAKQAVQDTHDDDWADFAIRLKAELAASQSDAGIGPHTATLAAGFAPLAQEKLQHSFYAFCDNITELTPSGAIHDVYAKLNNLENFLYFRGYVPNSATGHLDRSESVEWRHEDFRTLFDQDGFAKTENILGLFGKHLEQDVSSDSEVIGYTDLVTNLQRDIETAKQENARFERHPAVARSMETTTLLDTEIRMPRIARAPQSINHLDNVKPRGWLSGKWAAISSFATTAALAGVSRYALVAGATTLGAAALPAGIAAGIAVGAATNYWKNRGHIKAEMAKTADPAEQKRIWWDGFKQSFSAKQIGMTVAGGVAGAYGADWLINNPPERVAAFYDIAKQHMLAWGEQTMVMAASVKQAFESAGDDSTIAVADAPPSSPEAAPQSFNWGQDMQDYQASVTDPQPQPELPPLQTPHAPKEAMLAGWFAEESQGTAQVRAEPTFLQGTTVDFGQADLPEKPVVETIKVRIINASNAGSATVDMAPQAENVPSNDTAILENVVPDATVLDGESVENAAPETLKQVNEETAVAALDSQQPPYIEHVFGRKDTLWKIAQDTYGLHGNNQATRDAVEKIIAANPSLANGNLNSSLRLGMTLNLPAPETLANAPDVECNWKGNRLRNSCSLNLG